MKRKQVFLVGILSVATLCGALAWWSARGATAATQPARLSEGPNAAPTARPLDRRTSASCDSAFVPSTPGASRSYELLAGGRTVPLVLTLRAIRVDEGETVLDWAVEGRVGDEAMPAAAMLTGCVPASGSHAPWVGLLEAFLGVRWEGERFTVPANATAGDEWSSDAVWRGPNSRMREVRHARATGREACETPVGTRACLRYEIEVTLSDESPRPDRAATTHARGVEWVTEGIGLVRSELDDGSHLGPRLTLTAMRDP